MSTQATASFEFTAWDVNPYNEIEGQAKLTRESVTNVFKGDIEGESTLEYLMVYGSDGTASFIGHERVIGHIHGRSGGFVLQHVGIFEDGAARGTLTIVRGSGTGDLAGLSGQGSYVAGEEQPTPFTLDYDFE